MTKKQKILMAGLLSAALVCAALLILFLLNRNTNLRNNTGEETSQVQSNGMSAAISREPQTSDAVSRNTAGPTSNEIIELVGQSDPYELKPTMAAKQRYDLRSEIYRGLSRDKINDLSNAITASALQLGIVCGDNRYQELIDRTHKRWDIYDDNSLFGVSVVLRGIMPYVSYASLTEDLQTAVRLADEGLEERNILKVLDANRILQDLSRHLIQVPYQGKDEQPVDYGDIHEFYFKVTKTLEGKQTLMSE